MGVAPAPTPLVPLPGRLAVLLSGRGSNFEALADACERGSVPARIVAVVSDRPDARGLALAKERGLAAHGIARTGTRADHEARIAEVIDRAGADLVCLAGYMRILSPAFTERYRLRLLNIHPSLLPAFPGLEAQAQALAHGVKITGATVHFVDSGMDSGPIVVQTAVPVDPGDDVNSLSERVLAAEHRLYPEAVRRVLEGGWWLDGRVLRLPVASDKSAGKP